VKVTSVACEREVVGVVGSAVLSGNYMLDVVQEFAIVLVQRVRNLVVVSLLITLLGVGFARSSQCAEMREMKRQCIPITPRSICLESDHFG
jgi:hypothetical protein